jgi:hypothetical protein
MILFIALLLILTSPISVMAEEKGKLVSLLANYADHKQRVQDIRAARKENFPRDPGQMLELKRDLLAAIKAVDEYRTRLLRSREEAAAHQVPLALHYAYYAMFHVISTELDHHLYRSNLALSLSEKYADIWLTVDTSIPLF